MKSYRPESPLPPPASLGRRGAGFTLIEILVVLAIIAVLFGLLYAVYARAVATGRVTASYAEIKKLEMALDNYMTMNESYPIENDGMNDEESAAVGYFKVHSAPLNQGSNRTESNKALIEFLGKRMAYRPSSKNIRDGELVDDFGNIIIVRFLRKRRFSGDPDSELVRKVYIWSYGRDRINQVAASPEPIAGGPEAFDRNEMEAMERSARESDDIRSWVEP